MNECLSLFLELVPLLDDLVHTGNLHTCLGVSDPFHQGVVALQGSYDSPKLSDRDGRWNLQGRTSRDEFLHAPEEFFQLGF